MSEDHVATDRDQPWSLTAKLGICLFCLLLLLASCLFGFASRGWIEDKLLQLGWYQAQPLIDRKAAAIENIVVYETTRLKQERSAHLAAVTETEDEMKSLHRATREGEDRIESSVLNVGR